MSGPTQTPNQSEQCLGKQNKMHQCRPGMEGEGKGNKRRIWLKHWDNIDWRSAQQNAPPLIEGEGVYWLCKVRKRGWMTYCHLFHEAGLEPLSDAVEVQVDAHQAELPSPLDQLVRLHHQPLEETHERLLKDQQANAQKKSRAYVQLCLKLFHCLQLTLYSFIQLQFICWKKKSWILLSIQSTVKMSSISGFLMLIWQSKPFDFNVFISFLIIYVATDSAINQENDWNITF